MEFGIEKKELTPTLITANTDFDMIARLYHSKHRL